MSSHPLTHHEILAVIGPFSRRGFQADLVATQRRDRRLLFKATQTPTVRLPFAAVEEVLSLECRPAGEFLLQRALSTEGGPVARVEVVGSDPGSMLERVLAPPAEAMFRHGPGYVAALMARLDGSMLVPVGAAACIGAWHFELDADTVGGMPAEVVLDCAAPTTATLPDDLLAVLGWHWGSLHRGSDSWRTTLKLRGRGLRRRQDAIDAFLVGVAHLAETFADSPLSFHGRRVRGRWIAALRRIVPLVLAAVLIGIGALCTRLNIEDNSTLRVLLMSSPPILMILFFSLREVPRLELPPAPRRANAGSWPVQPR